MSVLDACMYVCAATSMPGVHGNQKRRSDPLELKLHMVVSCHTGALEEQLVVLITEMSLHPKPILFDH